jgi:hypothetical protein
VPLPFTSSFAVAVSRQGPDVRGTGPGRLARLAWRALRNFWNDGCPNFAAMVAFWAVLGLGPSVYLAGFLLGGLLPRRSHRPPADRGLPPAGGGAIRGRPRQKPPPGEGTGGARPPRPGLDRQRRLPRPGIRINVAFATVRRRGSGSLGSRPSWGRPPWRGSWQPL